MTMILPDGDRIQPIQVLETEYYTEGVVFDARGNLYFSETKPGRISILSPAGNCQVWAEVEGANGHKILPDGTHLVAAKSGVVQLNEDGSLLKVVADRFQDQPLIYPNDLTIDPQGGFYFTDSGDVDPNSPNGAVYYVDAAGELHQIAAEIAFANGIALTRNRDRLFVCESNRNRILVYAVKAPGRVEWLEAIDLPTKQGEQIDNKPDGICFDAAGNLFVAHYGMRQVQVLDAQGQIIRRYRSGNLTTSNCVFDGNFSLFVSGGIETEEGRGGIFRLDLAT
ncbi:SMP-30/gluconolactonase/LRE family protein [Microcoleus sp. FACHB-1515]|uniref:SMP-30/gluconolactonase/LRE family protein n=1 Tax=Cyanophyceae TaxID=3028117 RepID=UPI001688F7FD|nr:SMP-30/gluconolactonase/LRE family protein [Microcoleus sp. FACHB-1515]MBD2088881.1 SMP-30/gluconolactonase/LRE family protein [Microcoleus sp. FACHB-1515]